MPHTLYLRRVEDESIYRRERQYFTDAVKRLFVNIAEEGEPFRLYTATPSGEPDTPIPKDWPVKVWNGKKRSGFGEVETDYFDRESFEWKSRKTRKAKNEKNRKVHPAARGTDDRGTAVHRLGCVDHERGRRLTHEEVRAKYEDAFLKAADEATKWGIVFGIDREETKDAIRRIARLIDEIGLAGYMVEFVRTDADPTLIGLNFQRISDEDYERYLAEYNKRKGERK